MSLARISQRGSIMLPTVLIGVVLSLTMSALMNNSIVQEESAVENRLAEIRAYWAATGHFRYALSRVHHSGLCTNWLTILGVSTCLSSNLKDTDKLPVLQSYISEISSLKTFTYPEENAAYSIKIELSAAVDDDPTRNQRSGHLMITSNYPTTGVSTLPILSGLPTRFLPLQMRFCVGLASAGASCGIISSNNGGNVTGYYSVKRLNRLNSVS